MSDDKRGGYGRPPVANQFKKGRSGNPKGRPKGSKNAATVFKEALNKKVTIKDGNKVRQVTKAQAFFETALHDAIKGDNKARAVVVAMLRQSGLFELPPEDKTRGGGVLLLGQAMSADEWMKAAADQQRKHREPPMPEVKKPEPSDPKKLN